jgi:hypothetical protein
VVEVQPQISPLPEHVTPAPSAMPESAPAPTIQVTIGRVEVRATPATVSPRKPVAGPAVMSLEEYLRQRSAGGER